MAIKYTTTYEKHETNFLKAIITMPQDFEDNHTQNLRINAGKDLTANQLAHIVTFIFKTYNDFEIEFEIVTDENVADNEAEIILPV